MAELYILTGAAGAGKSTAQFVFEELGYFVMDNVLPVAIRPSIDFMLENSIKVDKALMVVAPLFAEESYNIAKEYEKNYKGFKVTLMTISCDVKTLAKRFKLTRHVHPSVAIEKISLTEAINNDKELIDKLSTIADYRIDTSSMQPLDLRKTLFSMLTNRENNNVSLCFMSFGHKHSIPLDVDLVLDTRALPNPYWVEELRDFNGKDQPVIDYLEKLPVTEETFKHMVDYLDFYIDQVQKDGRGNYTIGVCCSGGRHRSVYFAERLAKHYSDRYAVSTIHRDIDKD